jgi:hypothetical protein
MQQYSSTAMQQYSNTVVQQRGKVAGLQWIAADRQQCRHAGNVLPSSLLHALCTHCFKGREGGNVVAFVHKTPCQQCMQTTDTYNRSYCIAYAQHT